MMKTLADDPIHPSGSSFICHGLTKREYFAAIAMHAIMIKEAIIIKNDNEMLYNTIASDSLIMADSLINELNKPDNE